LANRSQRRSREKGLVERPKYSKAQRVIDQAEKQSSKQVTFSDVAKMMRNTKELVGILQMSWDSISQEFGISPEQIPAVIEYNNLHRDPPVETVKAEEISAEELPADSPEEVAVDEYDDLNGLNKLTLEEISAFFGENSLIQGVDLSVTIDNVRAVVSSYYNLSKAYADFETLEKELQTSMAEQEEAALTALKERAASELDLEKRAKAQLSLDKFYYNKHLGFLRDVTPKTLRHLTKAFTDQGRINYLLERGRIYMERLRIPEKFILEISSFEKRFLEEKYHAQNNMLLLYFLSGLVYSDLNDQTYRQQLIAFTLTMDRYIRRLSNEEESTAVLDNIQAFQDHFFIPQGEQFVSRFTILP